MHQILCFFGIHKWNYSDNKESRQCACCPVKQEADIDEEYQVVFWHNVK